MLYVPGQPGFLWHVATATGQPTGTFGTSVVPGNNAYGSYTELIDGALVIVDVWKIRINVHANGVATALRDTLLTIGIDPTAGTSYVDLLTHLMVSDASNNNSSGGVWYEFPFHIPAGSSIAAKASVNNATVGTLRCSVQLWGRPTNPEITKKGTIFRTFGEVTASSRGTVVVPGTTSEGAWTQLGSATAEPLWYWEFGFGVGTGTMASMIQLADIGVGDATTKRTVIDNAWVLTTSSETISKLPGFGAYNPVAVGDLVYGRLQSSATGDTDTSLIAYGVG